MNIIEWAEKEVEIACKKENPSYKKGDWDYDCSCYESALKAFKSIAEDGHSGCSYNITASILERLLENKPLTPIDDIDNMWVRSRMMKDYTSYQCNRMSSLFKHVTSDGKVSYTDVERFYCYDPEDNHNTWTSKLVRDIIDNMFPITMPYYPPIGKYKVAAKEFLTDTSNGDFDTIAIYDVITPNAENISIERYFKELENDWREIDKAEFIQRVKAHYDRIEKEKTVDLGR